MKDHLLPDADLLAVFKSVAQGGRARFIPVDPGPEGEPDQRRIARCISPPRRPSAPGVCSIFVVGLTAPVTTVGCAWTNLYRHSLPVGTSAAGSIRCMIHRLAAAATQGRSRPYRHASAPPP